MILSDSISKACVILAVIWSTPAFADAKMDAANAAMKEIQESTRLMGCQNEGLTANNIMLMRQSGKSPVEVMNAATKVGQMDVQQVVLAAFKVARVNRSATVSTAQEFGNAYEVACLSRK